MPATATVNADLSIALPHELQEAMKLTPGQTLIVERRGEVLEFRRAPGTGLDLIGSLSRYAPAEPVSVEQMNDVSPQSHHLPQ